MQYLSEYTMFDNVQELNYHVKQHTNRKYHDMNETQRQVLQVISQYSVKFIGVSHLKVGTIAKTVGKSNRTVIRSIKALVSLNIIDKLSTTRRISGGSGANIYLILPFISSNVMAEMSDRIKDEKPCQENDTTPVTKKETANLLSYYVTYRNTYSNPYKKFKTEVNTFIGDKDKGLVNRMYGVYLSQTKALRKVYDPSELIEVATEAIRETFTASKRMKLRNIAGYFNGVISNMLDDLCTYEMTVNTPENIVV